MSDPIVIDSILWQTLPFFGGEEVVGPLIY